MAEHLKELYRAPVKGKRDRLLRMGVFGLFLPPRVYKLLPLNK